jgi:hypothetical protein
MQSDASKGTAVVCRPANMARAHRLDFTMQIAEKSYQIYFDSPRVKLDGGVEAAVCMAALGAMRQGLGIAIQGPVSAGFLANQQKLADVFTGWFPQYLSPIWYAEKAVAVTPSGSKPVGAFFTGGVDSFYTFLKHKAEITDLIYVHGYDVSLQDMEKRQAISEMGAALERDTGVRFIEIETNAVRVFKDHGKWGLHGHGFGLGTVVRLLNGYLQRIYIPSSFAEAELMPWASHPQTDVLFGDESIEVVHDGCEVGRTEKIRRIATEPMALQHLRVCWEKLDGAYNCGECEKCLRTMTTLYGLGALHGAITFPSELPALAVRSLLLDSESARTFARDNVRFLDELGLHEDPVRDAWMHVATRPGWQNALLRRIRRLRKKWQRQWRKLSFDG